MMNLDPATLSALPALIGLICCYVGGLLTMTMLDRGDTSFIKAVGRFFIGWSIGLVIAILIDELLLPRVGIS